MNRFVDLHTHSVFSDGTLPPGDLVREARMAGLTAIALTDHDVLDGVSEARAAGEAEGVEIVAGVEVSTRSEHGEVHVLGLEVDASEGSRIRRAMRRQCAARNERADRIIDRLEALGMLISMREVEILAGPGSLGRPHIAAAMVSRGYVSSTEEAFGRFLRDGGSAYVEREAMSPEEAVSLIRDAGGFASIAHPAFIRTGGFDRLEIFLKSLADSGLEGLECFTSAHDEATTAACLKIARRLHLLPTGGSDFHGDKKPGVRLGHTRGGGRVPYAVLTEIRQHIARRRPSRAPASLVQGVGKWDPRQGNS